MTSDSARGDGQPQSKHHDQDSEAQLLAGRLREMREYLNLSQEQVAESTGLPRSAVSDIERGVRRVDSLELKRLSNLYGFPVAYFLGEQAESDLAADPVVSALARAAHDLREEDREEVLRFALFIGARSRSQHSSRSRR